MRVDEVRKQDDQGPVSRRDDYLQLSSCQCGQLVGERCIGLYRHRYHQQPSFDVCESYGHAAEWGSAKPPGIDGPIFDGKISTASETTIVSHATARLGIIEFHEAECICFSLTHES